MIEEQVLKAVEDYAYRRYRGVSCSDVGFTEEDYARLKVEGGSPAFTIDDVVMADTEENKVLGIVYYVETTLYFEVEEGEPIEGATDIYQCYRRGDEWCIQWHA